MSVIAASVVVCLPAACMTICLLLEVRVLHIKRGLSSEPVTYR
jgi:hypothetical protein